MILLFYRTILSCLETPINVLNSILQCKSSKPHEQPKQQWEDRERPATNTSKPDEMMLYNDTFENEAKERDGFAAIQPRSLSSKPDEECIEETMNNNAHFPQRGLNLKRCVLPIFLQEPLKRIKIDHSG